MGSLPSVVESFALHVSSPDSYMVEDDEVLEYFKVSINILEGILSQRTVET